MLSIFESHGVPNNGPQLATVSIALCCVAILFVGTRLVGRLVRTSNSPGLDDACVVIALLLNIVGTILPCFAVYYGFGRHGQDLTLPNKMLALKYFYIYQVVYKTAITFPKLSFLVLYLRCFRSKWSRHLTWGMIAFVGLGSVAFVAATVFQCTPISRAWNKTSSGHCINNAWFWYIHASWDIVTDIIIFLMPIPQIAVLNLAKAQKRGLIVVFLFGAVVLCASIMRMTALAPSAKATDPTWGSAWAWLWTCIELNLSIIVCCLPTLHGAFLSIYHKWRPVTRSPSYRLQRMPSSKHRSGTLSTWETRHGKLHFSDKTRPDSQERIMKTTDITIDFDPVSKEAENDCTGVAV